MIAVRISQFGHCSKSPEYYDESNNDQSRPAVLESKPPSVGHVHLVGCLIGAAI